MFQPLLISKMILISPNFHQKFYNRYLVILASADRVNLNKVPTVVYYKNNANEPHFRNFHQKLSKISRIYYFGFSFPVNCKKVSSVVYFKDNVNKPVFLRIFDKNVENLLFWVQLS